MSGSLDLARWSNRRWMTVIGAVFAVQVLLVWLVAETPKTSSRTKNSMAVTLLSQPMTRRQITRHWLVPDPTIVVLASIHGYSGRVWLQTPTHDYQLPDWDEAPRWLEFNVQKAADAIEPLIGTNLSEAFQIVDKTAPPFVAPPEDEPVKFGSRFHLEGDIARRAVPTKIELPPWAATDLLTNSVVQLSIDGRGEINSARLLVRSGLPAADRRALAIARGLRFRPVNHGPDAAHLVSGTAVFQWRTIPVTNGVIERFE